MKLVVLMYLLQYDWTEWTFDLKSVILRIKGHLTFFRTVVVRFMCVF